MSQPTDARRWAAGLQSQPWRVLLAAMTMAAAGCAAPGDPLWKRPGSPAIALEVDRAACKTQALVSGNPTAEQLELEMGLCLRQLGWYPER